MYKSNTFLRVKTLKYLKAQYSFGQISFPLHFHKNEPKMYTEYTI